MSVVYSKRVVAGEEFLKRGSFIALKIASSVEVFTDGAIKCLNILKEEHGIFYLKFSQGLVLRLEYISGVGGVLTMQEPPCVEHLQIFLKLWGSIGKPYVLDYTVSVEPVENRKCGRHDHGVRRAFKIIANLIFRQRVHK